jgi:hypothetical protein
MRPTLFVPVFIYLALCIVPLGLGLNLVLFPRRAAIFLHDAFAIVPPVESFEAGRGWFYRLLGLILLAAWAVGMYLIYSHIVALIRGL